MMMILFRIVEVIEKFMKIDVWNFGRKIKMLLWRILILIIIINKKEIKRKENKNKNNNNNSNLVGDIL